MSSVTVAQSGIESSARELARVEVYDMGGRAVTVESIWTGQATLFVFLRHYG